MSLSRDLLSQADFLVAADTRKPKQANLRRAVSAAYYALFHHVVAACASQSGPATPSLLRSRIGRAIGHKEIKDACSDVIRTPLKPSLSSLLPAGFSPHLKLFASTFVATQEARHAADYDTGAPILRLEAQQRIAGARAALSSWQHVNPDEIAVLLATIAFGKA